MPADAASPVAVAAPVQSPLVIEQLSISAATAAGRHTVVDDVSLELRAGRITGLAGESGSGKTVTALATLRLLPPNALRVEGGRIVALGRDVLTLSKTELRRFRGAEVSMIFQEPMTSLDPMFTVGSAVVEVLRAHRSISRQDAKARTIDLFAKVGLPDPEARFDRYPFELSGGMRQRVMIAMAIACEPRVLIADEPTTALDVTVQAQVMALLRTLADDGMAVLLVTHDMGVIAECTDDLTVMYAGQVIESGPTRDVLARPQHPYTAALIQSVPSPDVRLERLRPIEGIVPPVDAMPTGCRFAPRCDFAEPQCELPVALEPFDATRRVRCVRADALTLPGVP